MNHAVRRTGDMFDRHSIHLLLYEQWYVQTAVFPHFHSFCLDPTGRQKEQVRSIFER